LIAALIFLQTAFGAIAASAGELCRKCHPVHYAERGTCRACHRGNPASDRKDLAHKQFIAGRFAKFTLGDVSEVQEGMRLIEQYACRRCHTVAGQGNRLSVNLDAVAARKSPEGMAEAIRLPARSMPDFHCDTQGINAIINALLAASTKHAQAGSTRPESVHFSRAGKSGQDVFSRRCASCHSLLSEQLGALGAGSTIGPNLSGLFSQFYPKTFQRGDAWDNVKLAQWLKNPRTLRAWTQMQPVHLTQPELHELEKILSQERPANRISGNTP
jgi:cytochrome c2